MTMTMTWGVVTRGGGGGQRLASFRLLMICSLVSKAWFVISFSSLVSARSFVSVEYQAFIKFRKERFSSKAMKLC